VGHPVEFLVQRVLAVLDCNNSPTCVVRAAGGPRKLVSIDEIPHKGDLGVVLNGPNP